MAGAGKDRINVIKQELPKFIREFKERTNQREAPNVNTKREIPKKDIDEDDDDLEKADEAPVICVAKGVSDEEAYQFTKEVYGDEVVSSLDQDAKRKHDKDDEGEESGKVIFKKPAKEREGKKKTSKKESKMAKVKNQNLLSFGDEEEE